MTLFQSSDRQGFLVSIDLNQSELDLKDKLWNWMREKHSDIFFDIEMHEGGRISLHIDSIDFWGDNGVFTLEAVEIENIK